MTPTAIRERLVAGMAPHRQRLDAREIDALVAGFPAWQESRERVFAVGSADELLCRYLNGAIADCLRRIGRLQARHGEFSSRYARATAVAERQDLILAYAAELGAGETSLRGDSRAFRRWFGADAIADRYRRQLSLAERALVCRLERLGAMAARHLAEVDDGEAAWRDLGLEAAVQESLFYRGNVSIRESAFACLATALRALPGAVHERAISQEIVQYIYRLALESRQEIWLQCDAIDLLRTISPDSFALVAGRRLAHAQAGDDFFVRRRIVGWLGEGLRDTPPFAAILLDAVGDPSAYVRQRVASALTTAPATVVGGALPRLLREDPVAQVRAAAALVLADVADRSDLPVGDWLLAALCEEREPFVLRVLIGVGESCLARRSAGDASSLRTALLDRLDALHCNAADLRVRRWAAQSAERLWLAGDAAAQALLTALRATVAGCRPGRSVRLPAVFDDAPGVLLGRMLAVLAQNDYGFELARCRGAWRVWRGNRFGFRLWRWLHEMRHPSPDKRQAFRHTIGRIFRGSIHAPSGILAELAETKVPGEPLQIADEGGWRPYLPLVDALLSALDEDFDAPPLRIHTAEGVTEISPPAGLLARLRARSALTLRFAHFARLRNWQESGQTGADTLLREVGALGFRIRLLAHPTGECARQSLDPAVARFFPVPALATSSDWESWYRFRNYFFSVFENSLFELAVFASTALGLFVGRHLYLNHVIRRARSRLPLSIGGWGTRGKSGTERIKAALFNAMGYSVVSKTTGCEAMFLHGQSFDELREMFLFRPYDKATIWEQHNVVRLAEKLGAEVFLWECMALTPAFVQLLQRRWMKDDIATITNTFPDHEDLQGPAGIDIPVVMTNFIPERRTLLTSEEQMRPVLATAAADLGTRLRGVGWLESGLLAPDVLARFPYQEHPDNIALVVALADELGVPEDFALKAMADRVVPDLGVLKVYPVASIAGRRISFVNGMSANERFGCLGNWTRLGFDRITAEANPDVIVSTVVNNRADRVARSRVFAGILTDDIAADRHYLIGSNLAGLQGYIRESWQIGAAGFTLWPESRTASPAAVLAAFARRLRVPVCAGEVAARLRAMLAGQGVHLEEAAIAGWRDGASLEAALAASGCARCEETLSALSALAVPLAEYEAFAARLAALAEDGASADPPGLAGQQAALDGEFRELLWQWFSRKIVVVEDFHASGDQIIALIAANTPPGLENRVMGIQNIKGTGLDFVYRWQAWDVCHRACSAMLDADPAAAEQGLARLASFHEYGLLCEEHVRTTLATIDERGLLQQERQQAELALVRSNLDTAMQTVRENMQARRSSGRIERICGAIEGFLDAGDAIRRRRRADQIYADLVDLRISHARAAIELQALNKRQKGGWLYGEIHDRIAAVRASLRLPDRRRALSTAAEGTRFGKV